MASLLARWVERSGATVAKVRSCTTGPGALADEARRLVGAIRRTQVGDDDRTKVAELLAEATALLERDAPEVPLWHTGLTAFEGYDASVPGGSNREVS